MIRDGMIIEEDETMRTFKLMDKNRTTHHFHPVTGEAFTIDRENFMRNTHISPFQNSVRDNTNYFFRNTKEIEAKLDPK